MSRLVLKKVPSVPNGIVIISVSDTMPSNIHESVYTKSKSLHSQLRFFAFVTQPLFMFNTKYEVNNISDEVTQSQFVIDI